MKPLITIHTLLPRFRARGAGCIINIASRSATVDVPMTLGYVTSKAALTRATHTLQREMVLDGLDPAICLYALHPGGVLTGMGGSKLTVAYRLLSRVGMMEAFWCLIC